MSVESTPGLASSPTEVGNFVFEYSAESDIVKDIEPGELLQFLNAQESDTQLNLYDTNKAFYPRAITDFDVIENGIDTNIPIETARVVHSKSKDLGEINMAQRSSGRIRDGFQPDVITSASQRRPGPDGSPALIPSASQGFVPSSNLSETGELFAPVRQLTFSDIDQSSQVEDSSVNNSRMVSTPNKNERKHDSYDYSSMQGRNFRSAENNENPDDESDSSDSASDNMLNGIHGSASAQFRQLEGEADQDLINTGPFHPSAHGLSKEFMDNFVGKNGNQVFMPEDDGDIFSPLRNNPFGVTEEPDDDEGGVTPPLHSPGPVSPYAKKFGSPRGKKSPRNEHFQRSRPSPKGQAEPVEDPDEIQFAMSPTHPKRSDLHPFDQEMLDLDGGNDENPSQETREKFYHGNNDRDGQYTFRPIDSSNNKYNNKFNPAAVPKNLDEYFEQVTSEQFISGQVRDSYIASHERRERGYNSRQGDGSDHDLDERSHRLQQHDGGNVYPRISPSAFEQRYLQKTQVSVKLPQATYDTISANSSQDERFAGGDRGPLDLDEMSRSRVPPDVAQGAEEGQAMQTSSKRSPGKVMDLLQNQISVLKNDVKMSPDGSVNEEKIRRTSDRSNNNLYNQTSDNSRCSSASDLGGKKASEQKTSVHPECVQKPGGQAERLSPVSDEDMNRNCSTSKNLPFSSTASERHVKPEHSADRSDLERNQVDISNNQAQLPGSKTQLPSNQCHLPVSSRLLQETVSQRNKTTQKFVSSAPSSIKPMASHLGKDSKKSIDAAPKAQNIACSGSRKTGTNETAPKFKVSDKTKQKSVSSESLNTKQSNTVSHSKIPTNSSSVLSQSRHNVLKSNQSMANHLQAGQGQISQGRQGQASGRAQNGAPKGEGHDGSMHSVEEGQGHVVTQVQSTSPVPVEQPRKSTQSRQPLSFGDMSLDIKGMEEVRHQLQGMMRMSYDHLSAHDRSQYEHSDIIAGFGVEFGDQHRPFEASWNMVRKSGEEEFAESFPSFTSQYFTDSGNVSRSDTSVHTENQRLRDMLEKERYRRKHCEQYIQQLNVKVLETQQQLAVAVSTDKRKDIMIEQLDKQLARVMEGWKKRDQEKDVVLEDIQKEKEELENSLKQQQEMISNFEHDMSAAVEALRLEKEKTSQTAEELKEKVEESERAKAHTEEMLEAEREKVGLLQQECDSLREGRETLDKKLDQMQRRLHREQDDWFQREQELLQRIDEVSEKSNKILQAEKAKSEEQCKLAEEIMEQYQAANTKVKKLELELDAALREKESIKVEMGIMEAKFENTQRVLEADMHSTMEKQIAEQIADVQRRHEKAMDEVGDKHRQQMLELSKKHGKEMEKQLATFREELAKKEDDYRKQLQELETRLMEYRNENAELKRSKQKLESTRIEILTKLQYAMQSQWNEALSLLSATPQRQATQGRTPGSESVVTSAPPVVNFSLYTPNRTNENTAFKPPANQKTPPRSSASQSTPPKQFTANHHSPSSPVANEISPVPRHLPNQNRGAIDSPGSVSVISHSTERDPVEQSELNVENATMSHLRQFQEYMNSFTKTPEWIASINSQLEMASNAQGPPLNSVQSDTWAAPRLPSPPELASLLSTHLNNIQQQQFMPHPPRSVSQSQPSSLSANQRQAMFTGSASLPPDLHESRNHLSQSVSETRTLPPSRHLTNQIELSQSLLSNAEGHVVNDRIGVNCSVHTDRGMGVSWGGASGMSRAVPLHPPKQGEDPHLLDDQHSVLSALQDAPVRGYFQGGQSFSPPTKQNKDSEHGSLEDLTNQSNRLTQDYSQLSERLEQHGSHQQELQHYIQMLLNKSPGEVTAANQNDSLFSQENEELDLNDTAQAVQLQRELDRIQQLREKQESGTNRKSPSSNDTATSQHSEGTDQSKILSQEQLAEVTRLLNQVKGQGQGQSASPQVLELLELLKNAQLNKGGQPDQKKGQRSHGGSSADRHKGAALGIKRNMHFNPGKGVETSKPKHNDATKGEKPGQKPAQPKKVERKVAGSTTKGSAEKGPKPAAWK